MAGEQLNDVTYDVPNDLVWWREPDMMVTVMALTDKGRLHPINVEKAPLLCRVVRRYTVYHYDKPYLECADLYSARNGTLVARSVPLRQLTAVA